MTQEHIDWEATYNVLLPRVFQFFCYKVGDQQLAEELTAATFEKAWASRASFRKDKGQVHGWLFGIARHVAADHFRKPSREYPLPESLETANFDPGMEEDVQRRMDFQKVVTLLAQFPNRERDLVALKYGAELTNREIARMMRMTETNVGTILHRVVNKLREEMEKTHG